MGSKALAAAFLCKEPMFIPPGMAPALGKHPHFLRGMGTVTLGLLQTGQAGLNGMPSTGNHPGVSLEATLNQRQPGLGLAHVAHRDHSSGLSWFVASIFNCFILFHVKGDFAPSRITKNEIKAILLLIKMQLGTVIILRCTHKQNRCS